MKTEERLNCGVLPVYKPQGISSFDVIRKLRKVVGRIKMGHAGTLDLPAEGLLLVCFGKMTKLISLLQDMTKVYQTKVLFGIKTDTDDITGNVIDSCSIDTNKLNNDLPETLEQFAGEIVQLPPAYSALKVEGRRAYELARNGVTPKLSQRSVFVHSIKLLGLENNIAILEITCSKGTYIRSIARDLGEALGGCATMQYLMRKKIGKFENQHALHVDNFTYDAVCNAIWDIKQVLSDYPTKSYDIEQSREVANGILPDNLSGEMVNLLLDNRQEPLAVVRPDSGKWKFVTVFNG